MLGRLLVAGMVLAGSTPALGGTISIFADAHPDSVVIDVTVEDTGGATGCDWIAITRFTFAGCASPESDVFYFPRQVGETITQRFVDTDVTPNTLYCYWVDGRLSATPDPCPDFWSAFQCPGQHGPCEYCVNTGPNPGYIGQGRLWGAYWDGNHRIAWLHLCECGADIGFLIWDDAEPYLDTDVELDVYGGFFFDWLPGIWWLQEDHVVPRPCALAVEKTTWGRVKSLYRE